ncbi:MAG: hypothetical protein FWG16_03230 [Micrococcales bacterium]|nr:hypothetical protein [Micrococcales bacterium]
MTLTQTDRLSPADRCDRCGAQAYIRAVMQSGDLLFCAHHGRDQMEALKRVALEIDDQSDQLDLVLEQLDQSK